MLAALAHVLGLDNPSGGWYLAWSGFVADLGYLGLLGGMITLVRKHNCHVRRCWRVGRYPAGEFHVCRHHHPALAEAITERELTRHWHKHSTRGE